MHWADEFMFNQGNLQDFIDCKRRFQLKYINRQPWPAIGGEPYLDIERLVIQGNNFHQSAHRYFLEIPSEKLLKIIDDPDLERWWINFLQFTELLMPSQVKRDYRIYPEINLSMCIANHKLFAKFDLLIVNETGEMIIYDWKTSRKRPKSIWLNRRMQTRVYPYVLATSKFPNGQDTGINPGKIKMIYWFTDFPSQPEIIDYSVEQLEIDKGYLNGIIESIARRDEGEFHLTEDFTKCRYCTYRSFCGRGIQAPILKEDEMDLEYLGKEKVLEPESS